MGQSYGTLPEREEGKSSGSSHSPTSCFIEKWQDNVNFFKYL